jgi:hypothetical protein
MAKITGKAGRAMATVPGGVRGQLTRAQAQAELNILNNYKLVTVRGWASVRNIPTTGLDADYVVEQRGDGYAARVLITNSNNETGQARNVANLSATRVLSFVRDMEPNRLERAIRRIAGNRGVPIGTITPD